MGNALFGICKPRPRPHGNRRDRDPRRRNRIAASAGEAKVWHTAEMGLRGGSVGRSDWRKRDHFSGYRCAWRSRPKTANGGQFYAASRGRNARRLRAFFCGAATRRLVSWSGWVVPVREPVVWRRSRGSRARRNKTVSHGGSARWNASYPGLGFVALAALVVLPQTADGKPDQKIDE